MKRGFILLVSILLCTPLLAMAEPMSIEPDVEFVTTETEVVTISKSEVCIVESTNDYVEIPPIQKVVIDDYDLELLAHLIYAEAGSDWCDDEMLYGVGSVVLNRMASDYYPDNMYDVIYDKGQYACTWDGNIEKEPNERAYRIARDLLMYGSTLPPNVIFQAQFKQGDGVYKKVQNMYFCYINEEEMK